MRTPPKKRKTVIKKYRGLNPDGGGTPAQFIPCVKFEIDTDPETECGYIIEKLKQFSVQDGIQIQPCVLNTYTNETYPFFEDIKNATASRYKYSIAAVCKTVISGNGIMIEYKKENTN